MPWDDSKLRARGRIKMKVLECVAHLLVQIGHGRVEDGDWDGEETVEEVPMKDEGIVSMVPF